MQIYKAINAVQADLAKSGITKDRTNSQGSGYKFRGIDDVYNTIAPLLSKHGLCILPRVLSRQCDERASKSGGALFYVTVEVEFDFVAAEDGSKHTVKTFGEAMDSGDKATNKAMSAAYKYAAFQAFSIPTEGDNDADGHSYDVARNKPKAVPIVTALAGATDAVDSETRTYLQDLSMDLVANVRDGQALQAHKRIERENLDDIQKMALWAILDSKTRSAIKAAKPQPQKETA